MSSCQHIYLSLVKGTHEETDQDAYRQSHVHSLRMRIESQMLTLHPSSQWCQAQWQYLYQTHSSRHLIYQRLNFWFQNTEILEIFRPAYLNSWDEDHIAWSFQSAFLTSPVGTAENVAWHKAKKCIINSKIIQTWRDYELP